MTSLAYLLKFNASIRISKYILSILKVYKCFRTLDVSTHDATLVYRLKHDGLANIKRFLETLSWTEWTGRLTDQSIVLGGAC